MAVFYVCGRGLGHVKETRLSSHLPQWWLPWNPVTMVMPQAWVSPSQTPPIWYSSAWSCKDAVSVINLSTFCIKCLTVSWIFETLLHNEWSRDNCTFLLNECSREQLYPPPTYWVQYCRGTLHYPTWVQ